MFKGGWRRGGGIYIDYQQHIFSWRNRKNTTILVKTCCIVSDGLEVNIAHGYVDVIGGFDGKRERETQRETEREAETDSQTNKQTERDRQTDTKRERKQERELWLVFLWHTTITTCAQHRWHTAAESATGTGVYGPRSITAASVPKWWNYSRWFTIAWRQNY